MRRLLVLLAAVVLGASCKSDFPNPFENPTASATPPPDAPLIATSDRYASRGGGPHEFYAVGSGLTRLTFCNQAGPACDNEEGAPARDGKRLAVRRIPKDNDGDGRLTTADGESLVFVDLARSVESELVPAAAHVTGIDWSPTDEVLVYSANGAGGVEDLFRTDVNGQNTANLTMSTGVRERRPRIDPTGTLAVYERIDASGKGEIWVFSSSPNQVRVTGGGEAGPTLPGTPYVVGSDADPVYSPDGKGIAFRRLTGTGAGGRGTWDLLTVVSGATGPTVLVSGPSYRGAPDWGPEGIVFEEADAVTAAPSLVVVQPDGSGRRVLATGEAGFSFSFPRWLR